MPARKPPQKTASAPTRPLLQLCMAALGALVTLTVVGVVVWDLTQPAAPPALSARIVATHVTPAGQIATVRIRNDGDETALAVGVQGVLGDQTATASVDYVPGHGHAVAYLRFDADLRPASVSVKGWSAP